MVPNWKGKHTFEDDVQIDGDITSSIRVRAVDPESRLTDDNSGEYSRRVKYSSGNRMSIFNRIQKPSVSSGALSFGTGNYVSIPYNNIGGDITYALWFKLDDVSVTSELLVFMASQIRWYGGTEKLAWCPKVGFAAIEIPVTLFNDTWYRVVATQTGTTYAVYLDGLLVSSGTAPWVVDTSNYLNAVGYVPDPLYCHGTIDEVCIFSGVKDQAWVTADYNAGYGRYTPNTDANAEYIYHFDDGSGTTPDDSSGNSRDGTFSGTPTWVTGKVTPESSMFEAEVFRSEDGIMQGEAGIQTFGDPEGRTVVTGLRVLLSSADGSVNLPVVSVDPTSPNDGDVWLYENGATREIRVRMSGTTYKAALSV
jgi:hypothetical protein